MERAYTRKIWKIALPFWNFSSASPYSIFYRFWENQENGFAPQHKIVRCSTVLLGQGRFPILRKGTPHFPFFTENLHFRSIFRKNRKIVCAPIGQRYFPFLAVQNPAPERGAIMRKQVQKERCTKIKLEKCPRVCCLYDKVQLATARMLNADPSVVQIECNIPLSTG